MKGKVCEMNENKEMSDNAFWVLIVSVVAVCITALLLGLAVSRVVITTRYVVITTRCIDDGYTKKSLPGQPSPERVKEAK